MTCELKDCKRWEDDLEGCRGSFWPFFGSLGDLPDDRCTIAHRCCGYQPTWYSATWYWPMPAEEVGGAVHPGCLEAVQMWVRAGLPQDFRLPGQQQTERDM